jgi:hypothetical protein
MERHIRIKMDAHICCLMDRHIRITMGAYIYSGLMARNIRKYRASYSVPHVLVSAGILVDAGWRREDRRGSDQRQRGSGRPGDGRGGLGGRRSVDGDCGAVLSGCCRVRKRGIKFVELAANRFGRA